MKIVLAVFDPNKRGGKERDCLAVGKYLAARGHDVTLVATTSERDLFVPFRYRRLPKSGISNHARAQGFASAVIEYCAEAKPDVLLAFDKIPGSDFYYAAANEIGSRRPNRFWPGRARTLQRLERSVLEGAARTHIFFLTERQRDEYALIYHFDVSRSTVLPLVLHDERYEQAAHQHADRTQIREQLGLPRDAMVAISLAVFPKQKGADRTIAALASFRGLYLILAGSSDIGVKRQMRALKLEQYVRTIPYTSRVIELLSAADFLVHPARVEAAGQVIAEALLAGTPAIVSGNCGYASAVKRSGAGIVLPEPFEQSALVSGISDMMQYLPFYRNAAAAESKRQQCERGRWLYAIANEVENLVGKRCQPS